MTNTRIKYTSEELRQIAIIKRERAILCNPRSISYDFLTLSRIRAQMTAKREGNAAA